jgi:membrane protein DedA with SNARE-associated domain
MGITEFIAEHVTAFIASTGYITVFIAMMMESMVFPIPSEAVMPFAGFLIFEGKLSFLGVITVSTLASIVGSLISYAMGYYGGRPFINKFGKYFLLDHEELDYTERFFGKHGDLTILISRFIPVVRHLISIPAGTGRMGLVKFIVYTTVGAGMWNSILTITGYYLRQNWSSVMKYSHIVDLVILAILIGLFLIFVIRQVRKYRRIKSASIAE